MTPSEDPSGRLIDSLLREHARGGADEALLRDIDAALVDFEVRRHMATAAKGRRTAVFALASVAACLVIVSFAAMKVMGDRARRIAAHLPAAPSVSPLPPESPPRATERKDILERLSYRGEGTWTWYVKFGFESQGSWAPRLIGIDSSRKRFSSRTATGAMLKPGDIFFEDGAMGGRFRFLRFIDLEALDSRGFVQIVRAAEYEDIRSGRKYQSRSGLPDAELDAWPYRDPVAIFSYREEGGKSTVLEVPEGTGFTLPPGGGGEEFVLVMMDETEATVSYRGPSGETLTRVLRRK